MSDSPAAVSGTFDEVSRVVIRWLWLRKSLQWVVRSLPLVAALLVLLIVLRVTAMESGGVTLALALTVIWIAGCSLLAWWRRPAAYAALAFWDEKAARGDAFANAWWFEQRVRNACDTAQAFHVRTQRERLPCALTLLRRDIALPDLRRLAVVPALLLTMIFLPGGHGLHLPDARLTEEGRRLAVDEGKRLADKKLDADKLKALNEEEKKELNQLQQKIAETAKSLEQRKTESSREVLSELERRAHDAEKLAEKLGAGNAAWASEQMIAEMRKHADTAEAGDAVANHSADNTAREAQRLADNLRDPKLGNEACERLGETMKEIGRQAQPEDKDRVVGQHVITAGKDLAQSLPKDAGDEFQKLADKMRTLAAREKAREELEKLAQQLREAGSNIAGQGTQGMQQMAGQKGQSGQPEQQGQQQILTMQNAPQPQPMQVPGFSNAPQGQQGKQGGQQMQMTAPVPGSSPQGKSQMPAPGQNNGQNQNQGQGSKPMLVAPIPGTSPGQQPNATILGMAPGGTKAGNGTADLGNAPTQAIKPSQQGMVNAQRNADGESSVRAVEGQSHPEQASRGATDTALDSITAEENALDDSALPAARREQVRRYFTELRRRFEKEK